MHLVLVDFNNIFFRAFYIGDKVYTDDNQPIGAACAFIPYINTLVRQLAPTHMAMLRDLGKNTWRHKLYEPYKQNRSKTDPELSAQFKLGPYIAEYLDMPLIGFDNFEADDCIATLATCAKEYSHVTIVSTDKDLLQLLDDKVRIFNPHTRQFHYKQYVCDKFQIKAHQVREYLALIGDSADNLPGVIGIGPKSAVEILQHCEITTDVFDKMHLYSDKVRKKLDGHREQFELMHKLVTLSHDIEHISFNCADELEQYRCKKQYHNTNLDNIKKFMSEKLNG